MERNRKWTSIRVLAGGLAMFAAEMLVVAALVAAAWLLSIIILAVL